MAEMASFVSKIVLSYFSLSSKWEYEKSLLWLEIEKIISKEYLVNQIYVEVLADNYSGNQLFKKSMFIKSGCKKNWFRKEEKYVDLNIFQYFIFEA